MEEEIVEKEEVNKERKITPLPKLPLVVLFIFRTIDLLALSSLFPYLSQMTVDLLGLDEIKDANLVGYYSGYVAASYFVTQLVSAPFWGFVSDRIGRKPVLLMGSMGTGLTCILFGFSRWYWWALISRGLFGALNGNLGVAKTYLKEMCDDTNQSRAFSMVLNSSFSASIIIGPLIGGFLSRPHEKIPFLFDNVFFRTFPYVLPNLFLGVLSIFGCLIAFFFMKETRFQNKNEEMVENETNTKESIDVELQEPQEQQVEIPQKEEAVEDDPIPKENCCVRYVKSIIHSPILKLSPILSVTMYSLIGMQQIVFDEVLPIWIWTPTVHHGLGFEPYKIGIMQGTVGFFLIFFQLFLIPLIIDKLSIRRTFQLSVIMTIPSCFGVIELNRLSGLDLEWLIWVILIIQIIWRQVWLSMIFTTVNLMIGDSVPKEHLGSLNGVAQSMVALARTIGPSIAAPLFAMSISGNQPFPFGRHFTFYLSALILFMTFPLSFMFTTKK